MKIKPAISEKSLKDSKSGFYTFWVDSNLTKSEIKLAIKQTFNVNPLKVRTISSSARTKKNMSRKISRIKARKKAIVTLAEKEKIDLFKEE